MNAYKVTLIDQATGKLFAIVVRSGCADGMQEFVDSAVRDSLPVEMENPRVAEVTQLPDWLAKSLDDQVKLAS